MRVHLFFKSEAVIREFSMVQVNKKTINVRGHLLDLSIPCVMGIVNATPDSFYEKSRVRSFEAIIDRVGVMQEEGASIIDIGGYSTRPGAAEISVTEEIDRIDFVLEPITKYFPQMIVSIDTFRSDVARRAILSGAHMVNDVSGGNLDLAMFGIVAELGVPYILMHMRGTPVTMGQLTAYKQLIPEIMRDLKLKVDRLRALGVADIIIDPGFGFAKNTDQNFEVLRELSDFKLLGCPVLVGLSRKAAIYNTLNITAAEALNGTTVLHTLALEKGASILRVHDVKQAAEAVKLWMAGKGVN